MEIQCIGSGSGFNAALGNTSFLVNNHLLIDCGFTVPHRLLDLDKLVAVRAIAITHLHSDHIGGLELLGFMSYFVFHRQGDERPRLYLPTQSLADELWRALRPGMKWIQDDQGNPVQADLATYFQIIIGQSVVFDYPTEKSGESSFYFRPTLHVKCMESYSITFGNGVYFSGDTQEAPPEDAQLIFQDCQMQRFGPGDVHISYGQLQEMVKPEVRARIRLVHYGRGWEQKDPLADGFGGFVTPYQIITC